MGIAAPVFITQTRRVALSWALSQRLKDPAPLAHDLQQNSQSAPIHISGTLQSIVGQGRALAEAASVGAVLDPQSLPGPLPSACGIMSEYLDVSFAGNTSEECFGFSPAAMQVACSAQLLNITDPPRCGLLPLPCPAAGASVAALYLDLLPHSFALLFAAYILGRRIHFCGSLSRACSPTSPTPTGSTSLVRW